MKLTVSLIVAGLLASGAALATPGLAGNYYRLDAGPVSVAQALAAITGVAPTATFTATAVCFPSCGGSIGDSASLSAFFSGNVSNFSGTTVPDLTNHVVTLSGFVPIAAAGSYAFALGSDDGSELLVDGQVVVNNDGLHAFKFLSNSVQLTKGNHAISIIQFEHGGATGLTADFNGSPIGVANATTTDVAEPASLAVLGLGLGSFGLIARRRRTA